MDPITWCVIGGTTCLVSGLWYTWTGTTSRPDTIVAPPVEAYGVPLAPQLTYLPPQALLARDIERTSLLESIQRAKLRPLTDRVSTTDTGTTQEPLLPFVQQLHKLRKVKVPTLGSAHESSDPHALPPFQQQLLTVRAQLRHIPQVQ